MTSATLVDTRNVCVARVFRPNRIRRCIWLRAPNIVFFPCSDRAGTALLHAKVFDPRPEEKYHPTAPTNGGVKSKARSRFSIHSTPGFEVPSDKIVLDSGGGLLERRLLFLISVVFYEHHTGFCCLVPGGAIERNLICGYVMNVPGTPYNFQLILAESVVCTCQRVYMSRACRDGEWHGNVTSTSCL